MAIALCETSIYLGGILRPFFINISETLSAAYESVIFTAVEKAHRGAASQFFSLPIGRTCGGLKSVL